MANEYVVTLGPHNAFREGTNIGYNPWSHAALVGDFRGLRFPKSDINGYTWIARIPASLTMGTGLTFSFMTVLADRPDFDSDVGKVVRFGVTVKRLIDGETLDMDTAAGTEQTKDITLDATAGKIDVATLAIAAANLDSAVVGDPIGIRIRRIGSASQDTAQGSVVCPIIDVFNT